MQPFLQGAITIVVTGLVLAGIGRVLARSHASVDDEGACVIVPDPRLAWGLAIACGILGGAALAGALFHNGGASAWALGLALFGFGTLVLAYASPATYVTWTNTAITGPTSYGAPPFGPSRASIRFDDIVDLGVDAFGSFFVMDAKGNRIRWSEYYRGYLDLNKAIARHRPDMVSQPQTA